MTEPALAGLQCDRADVAIRIRQESRMTRYRPPSRATRFATSVLVLAVLAACGRDGADAPSAPAAAASDPAALHDRLLTIDGHLDIRDDFDGSVQPGGQFDLEKLEQGRLDVAVVSLFADPVRDTPEGIAEARAQVDHKLQALQAFVAAHPQKLAFARDSADLERLPAEGRHALLLGFLNAISLGRDVSAIGHYYGQGVRVFGLAHAGNNPWADSSRPNAAWGDTPDALGGLGDLGRQAVAELNRLGVIIDVSQLTTAGVEQTLALSTAPVIASHSGVRARVDNARNLSDAELKAIADKGGVVHVVAFASYLRTSPEARQAYISGIFEPLGLVYGQDDPKAKLDAAGYADYKARYRAYSESGWKYAQLSDYLDAIDHAVKVAGIDHVGISSDFNHGGGVTGFAHVGEAGNVTAALLEHGYSEEDVAKLWGGNFLRVFREVESAAAKG